MSAIKILVSDKLDKEGLDILQASGFDVDVKLKMSEDELCSVIGDYDCLIIRSGTRVTKKVIEAGKKLRVIGRAGVGVDNVDVPAASEKGILVMNTPSANTLSAAEHTCAMIMAAARNIPAAHVSMHTGEWERSRFTGVELNGKVLGVIGAGRVGGEVVKRMKAFNMTFIGYDPFLPKAVADELGIKLVDTVDEVITVADFMTIHTPLLPTTRNMISLEQFKRMKPTARLINVARGGIVNEDDLYTALKENIIAGAAFDVWCNEPLDENEKKLLELDNLITTPHLGASTVEAQKRVAVEVAEAAIKYLMTGIITNAVNAPRGNLAPETAPFVPLAKKLGSISRQVCDAPIDTMEVVYRGELAKKQVNLLTLTAVAGNLEAQLGAGAVNIINAKALADVKGLKFKETLDEGVCDYVSEISIKVSYGNKSTVLRGTAIGDSARLIAVDDFRFEAALSGDIILVKYKDVPGVIGKVGTITGEAGINVGQMTVARNGGIALMALTVDQTVSKDVLDKITKATDAVASAVCIAIPEY